MPYWNSSGVCSLKPARWRSQYPVPRTAAAIDYADISFTVASDIASAVDGVTYSWSVWEGGNGAPAGKMKVINGLAFFTYSSVNYLFLVSPGGTGGVAFTVTDDVASITVGTNDYQWPVYAA
jgi:hypothetical protein